MAHQGPIAVNTGPKKGRSANDKFVVNEAENEAHVWWGEYNRPFAEAIGQKAGRGSQQQVGDDEAGRTGRQNESYVLLVDKLLTDADHQPAKDVVVDGRHHLCNQQRQKGDRKPSSVLG